MLTYLRKRGYEVTTRGLSHYHFNWNATNNCRNKSSFGFLGCRSDLWEAQKAVMRQMLSAPWHLSRAKLSFNKNNIQKYSIPFPHNFPPVLWLLLFSKPQYRDRINSFKTKLLWLSRQRKKQFSSLKDMVYKSKSLDPFDAQAAETFNAPGWKTRRKDVKQIYEEMSSLNFVNSTHETSFHRFTLKWSYHHFDISCLKL